jgi:predicted phage terminase large subunit-like protein
VIQVWCTSGPNHYLVDQRRERMGFNATVKAIRAMCEKYPRVVRKLIEDKANGSAVIETLKHELSGVLPVEPDGGKEARANAVQPLVAAGNVFVPHPTRARYSDGRVGAPWVGDARDDGTEPMDPAETFLHEVTTFPKAEHDDQVDGMTQFLNSVSGSFAARMKAAVDKAAPARGA